MLQPWTLSFFGLHKLTSSSSSFHSGAALPQLRQKGRRMETKTVKKTTLLARTWPDRMKRASRAKKAASAWLFGQSRLRRRNNTVSACLYTHPHLLLQTLKVPSEWPNIKKSCHELVFRIGSHTHKYARSSFFGGFIAHAQTVTWMNGRLLWHETKPPPPLLGVTGEWATCTVFKAQTNETTVYQTLLKEGHFAWGL